MKTSANNLGLAVGP